MVSIIIPCYNAGKTILRTLESIYRQDCNNYEIITIDDGSKDNTLDILESHSKGKSNFKVITGPNNGVSHARNIGINESSGEYLYFLDADDVISPSLIKEIISNSKFDILYFSYEVVSNCNIRKTYKATFENDVLMSYLKGHVSIQMCSIVFSRKLLSDNNIRFDEDIAYSEDRKFIIESLAKAINIKYSSYLGFHYLLRSDSAMSVRDISIKRLSTLKALERCYAKLQNTKYSRQCLAYFKTSIYLLRNMSKKGPQINKEALQLLDYYINRYCGKELFLNWNKYAIFSLIYDILYLCRFLKK